MRIIFMGTPQFALPTLEKLFHSPHSILGVFSQPPKPVGRGYKVSLSPIHTFAEHHKLPIFTPKSLRKLEVQEHIKSLNPDIIVVAAYGLILPQAVLNIPSLGCINVHGSLLPRWRGASPIQQSILAGDLETGITLMQMNAGMDTGDMLIKESVPITDTTTSAGLSEKLSSIGADMVIKYLKNPDAYPPIPQPKEGVTHAPKIEKTEGHINWHHTAIDIDRRLRAFTPWPGCYTLFNGERYKIGGIKVLKDIAPNTLPGTVLTSDLHIACGQKTTLRITHIQKPGGKMLEVYEFIKGTQLPVHKTFDSPAKNDYL